ncbi:hypothetical protein ACFXAZ_36370 [Streptomyces sp. NPDC059477]|uniref:hypothetical protein n=1 Tax=Streptomyces sp. NPDC059477 TaxID=3346847 RepID=UPI0036C133FC
MAAIRVIVQPPSPTGGRRVRVDGEILGIAYSTRDLAEFLRRAGLEVDPEDVPTLTWIEWRGMGPDHWGPETGG